MASVQRIVRADVTWPEGGNLGTFEVENDEGLTFSMSFSGKADLVEQLKQHSDLSTLEGVASLAMRLQVEGEPEGGMGLLNISSVAAKLKGRWTTDYAAGSPQNFLVRAN